METSLEFEGEKCEDINVAKDKARDDTEQNEDGTTEITKPRGKKRSFVDFRNSGKEVSEADNQLL